MTKILDHGYIKLIETWGSDERIIEAARMSTDKGFQGWGHPDWECCSCGYTLGAELFTITELIHRPTCPNSSAHIMNYNENKGDEKLLAYLYNHKHMTPFEMAGMIIEVQAPIFVFREWHRHRTQSYNELSARYTPIPDMNYVPTKKRVIDGAASTKNKQASGANSLLVEAIDDWISAIETAYIALENTYQVGLSLGIPKELARIVLPVGRYSRMRASANLRNWLAFLTLRMDENAQWEIRQYANAVGSLISENFPRTWELFSDKK